MGFQATFVMLLAVFRTLQAQDANCDFSQNMEVGKTYYVSSPNYPNSYNPGSQCRWIATSPVGYNSRLDCPEINLPQSSSCSVDRLLVSRSGDPLLSGADTYCGKGTLTATSTGTKMSLGLISSSNSPGGKFSCSISAQPATPTNTCNCGYTKTNRIVGGTETQINEYPMMAGIVDVSIETVMCGAVMISDHYLLTAAHCALSVPRERMAIVVGEHDVTTGAESPATQVLRVSDILIHPQYNSNNYDNDISLILTDGNIVFSDRVGPACLPFKYVSNSFVGEKVKVLGWGTLFPGGPTSDKLLGVDLDVISQQTCKAQYPSLTDRQMCTFTPGKDACQSDSGGSLLYRDKSNGLIYSVGLISFGSFCASGKAGVNTRLTKFLDWIVASTPDANYCRI